MAPTPVTTLYMGTGTTYGSAPGLWRSTDGAASWQQLTNGIPAGAQIRTAAVDPSDPGRIYAAVNDPAAPGLYVSADGGNSWSKLTGIGLPDGMYPVSLAVDPFDSNLLYAGVGGTGMLRSFDGGASWQPFSNGMGALTVWKIAIDPADHHHLLAGARGGLYEITVTTRTLTATKSGNGSGRVNSSHGGLDCGFACSAEIAAFSAVVLTAAPDPGSVFVGWTGAGCSGSASAVAWAQASGLTDSFAGNTDWRLPTEDELLSLVDYTLGSPALSTAVFPSTPTASFWSATLNLLHANNAWETSFIDGHAIANSPTTSALYIRLVRSAGARLNLLSGWNLAGNSSTGPIDVAAAFGDATKVVSVWKWIASSAKWGFYTPSLAGQALTDYATSKGYEALITINGGEGFWVNAMAAFTAQLPAGAAIASASLQTMPSGWNLVAIGDNQTPSRFNALAGAGTSFTTLWAWDALQANWYFYAPSLDADGGLNAYITTKGYLGFGANNKTLGAGDGFWVNKP